jgi:rhombotail lipoprotein
MTIVGAYMLKGTRHDVITLMDLAVVDPVSRSILLRAGGTDERHGTTTLVSQTAQSRQSQTDGFSTATNELIGHFDAALTQFESDVRNGKANVRVVNRGANGSGNGGAGALDPGWILLLAMMLSARLWSCHTRRCD